MRLRGFFTILSTVKVASLHLSRKAMASPWVLKRLSSLGLHLTLAAVGHGKDAVDAIVGLAAECLDLASALNDESHGHALHAPGREGRLDLAP